MEKQVKRREFTFERKPARIRLARILEMLSAEALTEPEIAERLYLSQTGLWPYMKHLRETQQVYVAGWTRDAVAGQRTFPRAKYRTRTGNEKDRPKPKPLSDAQIAKRYRDRVKADPEKYERGYRRFKRNMATQQIRLRNLRRKQLIEAGFDPTAVQLGKVRVILTGNRRTPSPAEVERIIELREQGLIWKEVSARTGIPKSTCRTQYLRAKGELYD